MTAKELPPTETTWRWAERHARPGTVGTTGAEDKPGVLRVDFPSRDAEAQLERIPREASGDQCDRRLLAVGRSAVMQSLYRAIDRVAPTDTPVFLHGESGTDKELVAQAIHDKSRRHEGPFVAVNCGTLSENRIESALFGDEGGSITDAARRGGHFQRADHGTLFLDEITAMPLPVQMRLVRALETRKLTRAGVQSPLDVDVRVIAAASSDAAQAIADGKLREDFYLCLNTFSVLVPPLRERGSDIDLLTQHFLGLLNAGNRVTKSITAEAQQKLRQYAWPGNVRELQNILHRAHILADDAIDVQHLSLPDDSPPPCFEDTTVTIRIGTPLHEAERRLIVATLAHFDGNKRRAADTLGVSLKTIYNRLQWYEQLDTGAAGQPPGKRQA